MAELGRLAWPRQGAGLLTNVRLLLLGERVEVSLMCSYNMGGFVVLKLPALVRMVLEAALLELEELDIGWVVMGGEKMGGAVGWLSGVFEQVFDEDTQFMKNTL